MSKPYTYRIMLNSLDGQVVTEKQDPDNNSLGQPTGQFRYAEYQDAIQTLSQKACVNDDSTPPLTPITEVDIPILGEALFDALFDAALRTDFFSFYNDIVHTKSRLLRVELDINETQLPQLAALPWEFLHVPDNPIIGSMWLATAPKVIFSRRRAQWTQPKPIQLEAGQKLRIAVVVSTPNDAGLGPVSYTKLFAELETLKTELGEDQVQVELVDPTKRPATRDTLDDVLETYQPHIFHFVGHGRFQDDGGEIALVRDNGRARWVNAQQFAGLLTRHRPGIVLLQACEGGQTAVNNAFAGVGSQVVRHNVPVVVAMQYEISNATARKFAREFYKRLAKGDPVDKAAQEGRYEIADFHESRDFAAPVLYMRVRDGRLFAQPDTPPTGPGKLKPKVRRRLVDNLQGYFSLTDLYNVCFELGIDHEEFPKPKTDFIRELILYLENNNRVSELAAIGKRERDFLQWEID